MKKLALIITCLFMAGCAGTREGRGVTERQLCCYPPIYECNSTVTQRRMSRAGIYLYPACHCAVTRIGSRVIFATEINCRTGVKQ